MDEVDVARAVSEYRRSSRAKIVSQYELMRIPYGDVLAEYLEKDEDIFGVIYEGTKYGYRAEAYDIVSPLKDCWIIHISSKREGIEDIVETCILATETEEEMFVCAIFWYPALGIIKIKTLPANLRGGTDVERVIREVLEPMINTVVSRAGYEGRE